MQFAELFYSSMPPRCKVAFIFSDLPLDAIKGLFFLLIAHNYMGNKRYVLKLKQVGHDFPFFQWGIYFLGQCVCVFEVKLESWKKDNPKTPKKQYHETEGEQSVCNSVSYPAAVWKVALYFHRLYSHIMKGEEREIETAPLLKIGYQLTTDRQFSHELFVALTLWWWVQDQRK